MKKSDVIVIGGSAAGLTAALTCRRNYPEKKVLVIRQEKQVLVPCGIPYIFGTFGSPEKNLIPDAMLEKNGIDLLVDEVIDIDRTGRIVTTANGEKIGFEKLVIGTGSTPAHPGIPGIDLKNVFLVKKDVSYLNQMLEQLNVSSNMVIVGGGFIGAEFADECRKNRQMKITIVEMLEHCMMLSLGDEFGIVAEKIAKDHGIDILAPEKVEAFTGEQTVEKVKLASGKELKADIVLIGIGSVSNTGLAEKAGLKLGPTKSIQVNRYMQTSDENIFACGDCAEKVSFFDGQPSNLMLASIATREARITGANLFGTRRINHGVIGVFSTVFGDTAFASAGLLGVDAKKKGFNIILGESEAPNRHPGCMPGMAMLKVRMVFEKSTGVILGGRIMGAKSAGEMINTLSVCIHEKMTANDIALFPMGTHPALTASPVVYQLSNAAEMAVRAMKTG